MPPTVRLTLRTGIGPSLTGSRRSSAGAHRRTSSQSSASSSTGCWARVRRRGVPGGRSGLASTIERSTRLAFQCVDRVVHVEQVGPADHLLEPADAERGHDLADLLGHQHQVVDDLLGRAVEPLAQLGILGGDPDRAGVEVADAHHDAAHRDQRRGREAELVGAEQRPDDHVAAGPHPAVDLDRDPRAQVVEQQRLLGLGEPDLPRHAGPLDRGLRRGAGAAVVAGDRHVVGVGLGDARPRPCRPRPRRRA